MNKSILDERLKHLEDNIRQDLDLLKKYEDEVRHETDPRRLEKCHLEIERQRESLINDQKEYDELKLKKQVLPAKMQNIEDILQQTGAKLDDIQKSLPEIQEQKTFMPIKGEIFDVFLSHSHLDTKMVEELATRLEDNARLRVWLDRWILVPGKHWQQEMAHGLNLAKSCAVCIGEQTPKGWFKEEIERAINRQNKDDSFRVIPVLLPNAQEINVDDFLELRTWADFRNGLDDSIEFHRLVSGIRGESPGRGPQNNVVPEMTPALEKLKQLEQLHVRGHITIEVKTEYTRKILDRYLLMER